MIILFCFSCETNNTAKQKTEKVEDVQKESAMHFELPTLPESIDFCGQKISLTDLDIKERLDREILVNVYYQSATTLYLKRKTRFLPEIERILKSKNLPDDLKYVAVIESGLAQVTSPAGAKGFWQFMPATGKEYDLQISNEVDERYDFRKSTVAAAKYLKNAKDSLGSWVEAVAAYNRGVAGLKRDMAGQLVDSYFDTEMNSETGRYFFRLLAIKLIFENPAKYGYNLKADALYPAYKTKGILVKQTINDLAVWAKEMGANYKILTILNPWILSNSLTIKDKNFTILLPETNENLKPFSAY